MKNIFAVLCVVVLFAGCGELTSPRGDFADNPCAANDAAGGDITCVEKDCDDHDPCTKDAFNDVTCECDHKSSPDCQQCKPNADDPTCDDHNPCTTDSCKEQGQDSPGVCWHEPIPCNPGWKCKNQGGEAVCVKDTVSCDDGNACTTDLKKQDGSCVNDLVDCGPGFYCDDVLNEAGCYPVPMECVDGNVCTEDHYNKVDLCWWQMVECMDPINYHCEANAQGEPICIRKDYCESGEDCADEDPCNYDYCVENKCGHVYYWVSPGCCWAPPDTNPATGESWSQFERQVYTDKQCTDHKKCTWPDHCDMETNTCIPGPVVPGCACFSDATCDDGDQCTTDVCVAGKCQHQPGACTWCKPGAPDPTCNDGNPCTDDECVLVADTDNVGKCQHVPVEGCIP